MLLKQMGGISIPLPLSPATKLLMDQAKLTVSYSSDPETGLWSSAQALWGHLRAFSCLGRKMKSLCSWLSGMVWSIKVPAQEPPNSPHTVLHWCPGPMQLSSCLRSSRSALNTGHGCEATERLEVSHQPCFLSSLLIFFSTSCCIILLDVISSHTTKKKVANRPKCMQIYFNKRNGLWLEIKPGDYW